MWIQDKNEKNSSSLIVKNLHDLRKKKNNFQGRRKKTVGTLSVCLPGILWELYCASW